MIIIINYIIAQFLTVYPATINLFSLEEKVALNSIYRRKS